MVIKSLDENRKPTFLKNLSFYFTEYCENTSIHGLKFLGERGRNVVEKIWWIICIVSSLISCILLITQIYNKWKHSPVIVTFATTETPIWKIPFPAVTICPEVKTKRNVYNYTQKALFAINAPFSNENEENEFHYMSLICDPYPNISYDINASSMIGENMNDFLLKVAPPFDEVILNAVWLGEELTVENSVVSFVPILTTDGICYSFNLLDTDKLFTSETVLFKNVDIVERIQTNWTVENGYENDKALETYPRRTLLAGIRGGLELTLNTNKEDIDPSCGESLNGFKIIVQHSTELPTADDDYFRVPLDQHVVTAVKPKMMTTSDDLKRYTPDDRHCYFFGEKQLQYFKIYNQHNCLVECLTNFTYSFCDCVSYHMPREIVIELTEAGTLVLFLGHNSTPICDHSMFWCLDASNVLFLSNEVTAKIQNPKGNRKKSTRFSSPPTPDCNCLPSCNSLEFEMETSQSSWNWRNMYHLTNYSNETNGYYLSKLKIFFKDMQFMTSERNQLYGYTDFWANCGGLLGLFTGFSFISLAEVLYFLTLRFISNVKTYGHRYWSGAKELIENKVE